MPRPELSLVIPIYNEEAVLPQLDARLKELLAALGITTEVLFVNDGSRDRSLEILRDLAGREPRYRVIGFSRNFGHQRAITAGMETARGKAVVVMDADLQDPPEVILEMVAKWKEGFDVVYGRRRSRVGESSFKLLTAKIFYRLFAAMIPIEVPLDTGDFRLMSRRVVTTMRGLRETHRFVRGLVAWVGFKQTAVEYDRSARAAGETKYPFKKMLAFAIDGIASFSILPLRFATYTGALVGTAAVLYAIIATITYFSGRTVPGWTTSVVLVSLLFSVQFFMIGVLGEYVGRIYEQVKGRPLYVIAERINFGRRRATAQDPLGKTTENTTGSVAAGTSPSMAMRASPGNDIPPPPSAVIAAGAAAEAAITRPPPRKSVTPAPPSLGSKPPPLKLSSSLSRMPSTPPSEPVPHTRRSAPPAPPRMPSFPAMSPLAPPVRTAPSVQPPRVASGPPRALSATGSIPKIQVPQQPALTAASARSAPSAPKAPSAAPSPAVPAAPAAPTPPAAPVAPAIPSLVEALGGDDTARWSSTMTAAAVANLDDEDAVDKSREPS